MHKRKVSLGVILVSALAVSVPGLTVAKTAKPAAHHAGDVVLLPDRMQREKLLKEKAKQVVQEAVEAVMATRQALTALEHGNTKEAEAALEIATGKLHLLVARYPELGLLPVDVDVVVRTLDADAEAIKKAEKKVEDLVDDKRYQDARVILDQLRDDITVTVVSLPLATYPQDIEAIAPLIDAGKLEEAKAALAEVLGSLVVTEEVIPLAVLRAEDILDKAFTLEHTADLNDPKIRDTILKLTQQAKENLAVAQFLGYGKKKDYKLLYNAISALEKTVKSKQHGGGLWNKVKQELHALKQKVGQPREKK